MDVDPSSPNVRERSMRPPLGAQEMPHGPRFSRARGPCSATLQAANLACEFALATPRPARPTKAVMPRLKAGGDFDTGRADARVLLVDPSFFGARLLLRFLREPGLEITWTDQEEEALGLLEAGDFHLLLVSLRGPAPRDCRLLRLCLDCLDACDGAPLVVVSSYRPDLLDVDVVERVDTVLVEPLEIGKAREAVRAALGRSRVRPSKRGAG